MAQSFNIQVHNYRGFSGDSGFEIFVRQDPFVCAYVGPNNTGKSTIVRFIAELKHAWTSVRAGGSLTTAPNNTRDFPSLTGTFKDLFPRNGIGPLRIRIAVEPDVESTQFGTVVTSETIELYPDGRWIQSFNDGIAASDVQFVSGQTVGFDLAGKRYDLCELVEAAITLSRAVYLPPFRNIIKGVTGGHFGRDIGKSFVSRWATESLGTDPIRRTRMLQVQGELSNILRVPDLRISASADQETLIIEREGQSFSLDEMGSGVAEVIYAFAVVALEDPLLLLIDEPELHLHPALQVEFVEAISRFVSRGVLFATHSVGLARATANEIYACQRDNKTCTVRPFDTPLRSHAEYLGELSFSQYPEVGYRRLLMVEGVTDIPVFRSWLRQWKKDHEIAVFHLGGRSTITRGRSTELTELKRIAPNCVIVIDSERKSEGASLGQARAEFISDARSIGIDVHVLDRTATENYFPEHAIQAELGTSRSALKPFEKLSKQTKGWTKARNGAIARHMQKRDLKGTDIAVLLDQI